MTRAQRIRRVIGPHGNHADVVFAVDLIGKNNFDFDVKSTVRHFDLQTFFANGRDMLLVDVDESDVIARAGESAADDAADGSYADDDYAHGCNSSLCPTRWIDS